MDNLVVVKHNKIVEAGYRLSIYESRILLCCIAQINSMGEINAEDVFTINAKELMGLTGVDSTSCYRHLKTAAESLYERSAIIELGKGDYLKTRWVSAVWFRENDSTIEVQFAQKMLPYISQIRRDFTQYRLENILKFTSSWSIRFYELIVKWEGKEKFVDLKWLKTRFQLEDKYDRVCDLRRRVLDVAVKEINEHSDMKVSYTQEKRGRRVIGFTFKYSPKDRRKLDRVPRAEIEKQARPGESYDDVRQRLHKNR